MNIANQTLVAIVDLVTSEDSVSAARRAFDNAGGEPDQRFRAALRAALGAAVVEEPQLDLPEGWEDLDFYSLREILQQQGVSLLHRQRREAVRVVSDEVAFRSKVADLRAAVLEAPTPTSMEDSEMTTEVIA